MKQRGITLTELLVVVFICALLMALLLPVLVNARRNARLAPCMTNLRQIHAAWSMYLQDYNDENPVLKHLVAYSNSPDVFKCPLDTYGGANRHQSRRTGFTLSYYFIPHIKDYFRDLNAVDANHGIAACVLHGEVKYPSSLDINRPGLLDANLATTGRVLRLRVDGSITVVSVPLQCFWKEGTTTITRCFWDLFTDARTAPQRSRWCSEEEGQPVPCR